jgi:small GTP-binding protein
MIEQVLDQHRRDILAEERRLLSALLTTLAQLRAPQEDQEAVSHSLAQLGEMFLLVVVGEFNAGKSAVINALLGDRILDEGVTPTTSRIGLLRYGPAVGREAKGASLDIITAPVEVLRELNVVDTPGTNAVLRDHEALTREFVPRSDLVIFVTSADRPFTESERAFLATIRDWGKKVVVVVNKADILETSRDLADVLGFVKEKAAAWLGLSPEIHAVSARQALRGKAERDDALLSASGFGVLERFLTETLDQTERVRLKLLNPLGVGLRVLTQAEQVAKARLSLLDDDFAALEEIDGQLDLFCEDLARDFRFRLADVETVLLDLERRGNAFFEDTLRLGRIIDLLNRERIRDQFEQKVVADLPRVVERRVDEIVDWMVASELKQFRAISELLRCRQAAHAERMVGHIDGAFESDRVRLLEEVRRQAQRAVESFDHAEEARRLAASVRDIVAGAALLQVGAIGLGAAVTALATTTFADVTGVMAAGALSILGLLLLPARRQTAHRQLRARVAVMRETLMATLSSSFDGELERSRGRILEAIAPYSRFVRSEGERLRGQRGELTALRSELEALKARIESL